MDLYFADKPAGVTTHTSLDEAARQSPLTDIADGFCEHLSARTGLELFVVHRLDRGTTGAICFARSSEAAERLRRAFESRSVRKRYLFLTDADGGDNARAAGDDDGRAAGATDDFVVESYIERRGSEFVSDPSAEANARTHFRKLARDHGFTLWEARPETGKPHQIRLHAADAGIPILGDDDHGGTSFPTLALHSAEIEIEGHTHTSLAPIWFERRELAADMRLCHWLAAIDRRERLQRSGALPPECGQQTLRWIHSEGDPLRAEQLGDVYSLSWFSDREPTAGEWKSIERLAEIRGWTKWYLQIRGNRGRAPHEEATRRGPIDFANRWTGRELEIEFEFRTDCGLSPGLFLDQRRNRQWVRSQASGKRVLNLFCYTAGFSVAAAKGGARQVVSLDVSKTFLDWGKRNFELNGLSTEGHEFRAMDSRDYLMWAKKKGLFFDLVICDPPSFSRSKSGLFRIEDDYESLLGLLLDVKSPDGTILFASNFEKWEEPDFEAHTRQALKNLRAKAEIERTPPADWDFELPGQPRNMKSFFLR